MLKDHFYHIIIVTQQENVIVANLQLNPGHEIFKGHFPAQPVVPGACLLQIVKEVLADASGTDHHLKKAAYLKFISPVDPRITDTLQLNLTCKTVDAGLLVTGSLSANGVVCFKMQGIFIP